MVGRRVGRVQRPVAPPHRVGRRQRALGVGGDPAARVDRPGHGHEVRPAALEGTGARHAGTRGGMDLPVHARLRGQGDHPDRQGARVVRQGRRVPQRQGDPAGPGRGERVAVGVGAGVAPVGVLVVAVGVEVDAVDVEVEVVLGGLPRVHRAVPAPGRVGRRARALGVGELVGPGAEPVGAAGLHQVALAGRERPGRQHALAGAGHRDGLVGQAPARRAARPVAPAPASAEPSSRWTSGSASGSAWGSGSSRAAERPARCPPCRSRTRSSCGHRPR